MKRVNLSESVVKIDRLAFASCMDLREINMSDNVVTVSERAFENCHRLTFVQFGYRLKSISDCAFRGCRKLVAISIPLIPSMRLHNRAFLDCPRLRNLTIQRPYTGPLEHTLAHYRNSESGELECRCWDVRSTIQNVTTQLLEAEILLASTLWIAVLSLQRQPQFGHFHTGNARWLCSVLQFWFRGKVPFPIQGARDFASALRGGD